MKPTTTILLLFIQIILTTQIKLKSSSLERKHRNVTSFKQRRYDQVAYLSANTVRQARVSQLWLQYYKCVDQLVDGRVTSDAVMVYETAVARLPCRLCVPPDAAHRLIWMYAQSLANLSFAELDKKERYVRDDEVTTLSIYRATREDAGVYRCELAGARAGHALLEVAGDEEYYDVVKPSTSRGPHGAEPVTLRGNLSLFTAWSDWSLCSRCGRVGRRRRYGICTVRLKYIDGSPTTDDDAMKIFRDFPMGIPCRSKYLPDNIKYEVKVQERPSEIMIGMCKVPCSDVIYEVRSRRGRVLERVNNSAGVFSLAQRLPPPPPPPVYELVFVELASALVIGCPGTSLRDAPVRWSVAGGSLPVASVEGRVRLTARDRLVFTTVVYGDACLYTCAYGGRAAGGVRVRVWRRGGGGGGGGGETQLLMATFIIFAYVCVCCYFAK